MTAEISRHKNKSGCLPDAPSLLWRPGPTPRANWRLNVELGSGGAKVRVGNIHLSLKSQGVNKRKSMEEENLLTEGNTQLLNTNSGSTLSVRVKMHPDKDGI